MALQNQQCLGTARPRCAPALSIVRRQRHGTALSVRVCLHTSAGGCVGGDVEVLLVGACTLWMVKVLSWDRFR